MTLLHQTVACWGLRTLTTHIKDCPIPGFVSIFISGARQSMAICEAKDSALPSCSRWCSISSCCCPLLIFHFLC
jgi:hypothetical protein